MLRGGERGERFGVGRAGHAAFGEDGGDVFAGGDVEGGVRGLDVGSDADSLNLRDFGGRALFDRDVVAVGNRQIKSGNGRGDVERNVVFARR